MPSDRRIQVDIGRLLANTCSMVACAWLVCWAARAASVASWLVLEKKA